MRERIRHLGLGLAVGGVVLGAAVVLGGVAGGGPAALGAAGGVLLVLASYTASTVAIAWADTVNPRLVLPVGMGMYVTKFSLFGVLVLAVGGSDWPGKVALAMGVAAGVVSWTTTQILWTVRHAHPYTPAARS